MKRILGLQKSHLKKGGFEEFSDIDFSKLDEHKDKLAAVKMNQQQTVWRKALYGRGFIFSWQLNHWHTVKHFGDYCYKIANYT